jgi:uncharacterized membrane protein YphA (DoxX/SURF4 family)
MSQTSPIATDRSQTSPLGMPGIVQHPGRTLLGLILVFGAYTKLHFNGAWHFRDYHFFLAMAIGSYRTLPYGTVKWLALVLPWVELTLGALLIAGVGTRWASLVTSALLVFMAFLPRSAILGLASRTNPATELLVDIGFFLVALTITLKAFHLHRAGECQS